MNSATTVFIGEYYQVSGSSVTMYYAAGMQQIAVSAGNGVRYVFADPLGSTTVTADASGCSAAMQLYKAWGEVRTGSLNALATRYTFTGQAAEDSLGLMFYHARWYDPLQTLPGALRAYSFLFVLFVPTQVSQILATRLHCFMFQELLHLCPGCSIQHARHGQRFGIGEISQPRATCQVKTADKGQARRLVKSPERCRRQRLPMRVDHGFHSSPLPNGAGCHRRMRSSFRQ